MKSYQFLLISFLCLIYLTAPCFAKEWRNIFPLKTTRAEVIKMLGNSQKDWSVLGERFDVENDIVRIRWTRPDCFGVEAFLYQQTVNSDSLAYQISFIPKAPLSQDVIKKEEPKEQEETDDSKSKIPKGFNLSFYDTSCLTGGNGTFACSLTGDGFGYSNSNRGVTSLYYYPTQKEIKEWEEKRQPCSVEQK